MGNAIVNHVYSHNPRAIAWDETNVCNCGKDASDHLNVRNCNHGPWNGTRYGRKCVECGFHTSAPAAGTLEHRQQFGHFTSSEHEGDER